MKYVWSDEGWCGCACIVLQCTGSFGGSGEAGFRQRAAIWTSHISHILCPTIPPCGSSILTFFFYCKESPVSLHDNSNQICWLYFMCSPEKELIKKLRSGKPFQKTVEVDWMNLVSHIQNGPIRLLLFLNTASWCRFQWRATAASTLISFLAATLTATSSSSSSSEVFHGSFAICTSCFRQNSKDADWLWQMRKPTRWFHYIPK